MNFHANQNLVRLKYRMLPKEQNFYILFNNTFYMIIRKCIFWKNWKFNSRNPERRNSRLFT